MKKLLFLLFIIYYQTGFSQSLELLSGNFPLTNNINTFSKKDLKDLPVFENTLLAIIRFNKIPNSNEKQLLLGKGIHLLKYLPKNAFFATLDPSIKLNEIKNFSSIAGIHKIKPQYKKHPKLNPDKYPDWILEGKQLLVVVTIFETLSFEKITQLLIKKSLCYN